MRLSELDYDLPQELIAQYPLEERDQARLMMIERRRGIISHSRFYKLPRELREGDLLVLNDTKVIAARLVAHKESGGAVELLLIPSPESTTRQWQALVRAHRPPRAGTRLLLDNGRALRILAQCRPGRMLLESADSSSLEDILAQYGTPALPHYIRRSPTAADVTEYQTVYAAKPGAVAAPTAGIHFTPELLEQLDQAGIRATFITLHIGPGTFTPLRSTQVEHHSMEAEWYTISDAAARAIEWARRTGGRVVGVGTSTVRALESYAVTGEREGFTGLFIYPGFRFKLVDAMLTNFHMPRSTVLALVMALAGRELILRAYAEAIRHRYRFLSYGDATLVV
jgi:S-adenosylmethionine:tRNA ribosyltransferase-isomerase